MCGIIASFASAGHADAIRAQYKKQESRGNEGFGFIALKGGRIVAHKRGREIGLVMDAMERVEKEMTPDAVLFHHRFPTSTPNTPESAHPLPIAHDAWRHNYYILHNGHVSGAPDTESAIERGGYTFTSKVETVEFYRSGGVLYEKVRDSDINDSELLGYYTAQYLEGLRKDIPLQGAIASIVVQESKATGICKVYAMRNYGNPLMAERSKEKGTFMLASECGGAIVEAHALYCVVRNSKLKKVRSVKIGKSYDTTELYGATTAQVMRSIGYETDAKTIVDVPARDTKAAKRNESEGALIGKAIGEAYNAADQAYSDWQDATGMMADLQVSETERIEMEEYAEELRLRWHAAEDALETLLEDNGMEYGYGRRDRANPTQVKYTF